MMTAEEYASNNLSNELIVVSRLSDAYSFLSVYEKAIIHKYTDDGFENLNGLLRENNKIPLVGTLLVDILSKMPPYQDVVFRGVDLSEKQIETYINAFETDEPVLEKTFVSTSRSMLVARQFGKCVFTIYSKSGKNIEQIAKHNQEKEVLFVPNSIFTVLEWDFDEQQKQYEFILREA